MSGRSESGRRETQCPCRRGSGYKVGDGRGSVETRIDVTSFAFRERFASITNRKPTG